ncbi:MAG: cytochrome-c oxidase, cbb3-type subunit III [Gammaproteobacteria bacterium]|nr:cytochrome-c oxidase, cbb3-type subunit III [Gammaproteobacteria bacterium]
MSSIWHWFVVLGTLGSLVFFLALLYGNRKTSNEATTGHVYDGIEEYDNPMPMWWVWMFVLSIVFALGYLVYYPGLGNFDGIADWSSDEALQDAQEAHEERFAPLYAELAQLDEASLHDNRQAMQVGRRLFINNCSTCHGVNARGSFGFPNLTDSQWLWGSGLDSVKTTIINGRNANMPGWQSALGDRGVADVTQYTLALAGRDHDGEAASRGEAQYNSMCIACHGAEGKGNSAMGAPDLTNDIWLYGGTAERIAYTIRNGRQGRMPAFDEVLSADKIHVLSGYVTSLGDPE